MDYSKTVNLLQTAFPMKADLPRREPAFLEKWEKGGLYEKIQTKQSGKSVFLLHDGPPYANGLIHMGTALNKVLKDFVVKFKTLDGFHCPYKPGWDCHGLPIEHQLFKELKKSKHDISRIELRDRATEYALKFVDAQRADFKRLGVLGTWSDPYLTLSKGYEASIVETFFELRRKGYIYRQLKPGYWCAFDETALAEAEVDYADKKSDSVFVRFAVQPSSVPSKVRACFPSGPSYVLIWTTTPWTLPANVGLALHPDEPYVSMTWRGESYLIAEKLMSAVEKKIGGAVSFLPGRFKGKEFVGLAGTNPLNGHDSKVVTAPYVTMEDGTGVVHIAPGHGLEDYAVGLEWNLPILSPVDEKGQFVDTVGHPALVGKSVLKDANQAVMDALGPNLLFNETIRHSYPHCWRCKNPVLFRATEQWFMRIDDSLRNRLLEEIDVVKWEPAYGIHRIKGMVEQRPDWCLSRQRHWGAPIAVLYCKKCRKPVDDPDLDRKIVSLIEKDGGNAWYRKSESELAGEWNLKCPACNGTDFEKEMDILDVWFDSGVSWHAVIEKQLSDPKPLTVMYLEGSDQHRGWFQTSLIPSVALRNKAPYDIVMTHGFVVDGKGRKMSKSTGNVIAPQEVIGKYGADVLRLWVAMSDYREDIRLSQDILKQVIDVYRRFRNIFRFLLQNTADFKVGTHSVPFEKMDEIDQWILVNFEEVVSRVKEAYDKYEFHVVLSELNRFAAVTLSGFYLDALKDRLYCESPDSPMRRSAQTAFVYLLRGIALLLAPLLSFTTEEAYLELRRVSDPSLPESVFMDDWGSLPKVALDPSLNDKWTKIMEIRGKVNDILDRQRKAGVLKSSQEASVVINRSKVGNDYNEIFEESGTDWPFLLQMAEVRFNGGNGSEEVEISATSFKKCERCWRHRDHVGKNKDHPTLCARCAGVVTNTRL